MTADRLTDVQERIFAQASSLTPKNVSFGVPPPGMGPILRVAVPGYQA